MLFKDIEKLVKLIQNSDFDEFEWEKNRERIRLKKSSGSGSPVGVSYIPVNPGTSNPAQAGSVPSIDGAQSNSNSQSSGDSVANSAPVGKEIICPFVGTFYSAPSPELPNYTEVGKQIKKGDVLCIVEAMKIMNEIEAEFSGTVLSVLVKSGQAVQYGQPLFVVDPN